MKFIVRAILLVLCVGLQSMSAIAKTIEVKTENFIFIGDVRESDAKYLVGELETYRSAILQLLGQVSSIEPIPVRIYTAKNKSELEKLTGRTGIGGVYTSNIEGPIFILNSRNGFRRGKQARHIALHEYTHHLLATYTDKVFPRWYNEGFANYLSTFEKNKKGQLLIGKPYNPYGVALSQKRWMPMSIVTNSVRNYPFKANSKSKKGVQPAHYFYAQSWLAVHYIQSTKGKSAKMAAYLKRLNEERRPENAFAEAFGTSPEDFEKTLRAYYKKNRFSVLKITPTVKTEGAALQARVLSKGEAAFHKAEAMRFFSGKNVTTAQVSAQYDKAAETLGETAHILAARADLSTWENEYSAAQTLIEKALALAPKDPIIARTAGTVLLFKNKAASSPNAAEMKAARQYFKRAMIADANDVAAHYYYAKTYAIMREKPSAQALASTKSALNFYRGDNFTSSNLMLAELLMHGQKYEEARPIVEKAIVWSRSANARRQARKMRSFINTHGK